MVLPSSWHPLNPLLILSRSRRYSKTWNWLIDWLIDDTWIPGSFQGFNQDTIRTFAHQHVHSSQGPCQKDPVLTFRFQQIGLHFHHHVVSWNDGSNGVKEFPLASKFIEIETKCRFICSKKVKINENLWALTSHWAAITSTDGRSVYKCHKMNPHLTERARYLESVHPTLGYQKWRPACRCCSSRMWSWFVWVSHFKQGKWKRLGMCKVDQSSIFPEVPEGQCTSLYGL